MIQAKLAYPPSANSLWRSGGGRVYRSKEYVSWIASAAWDVKRAVLLFGPVHGPYRLHIEAGRPDRRKRDIDNIIKPVSDSLMKGGAIKDDSDCLYVSAEWVEDLKGVRVTISSAEGGL